MTENQILEEMRDLNSFTKEFLEIYKTRMHKNQITSNSEMNAFAKLRKDSYAGSGFIKWGAVNPDSKPYKGIWFLESLKDTIVMGNFNEVPVDYSDRDESRYPILNVDGDEISLIGVNNIDNNYIRLPSVKDPVLITDMDSVPQDLRQGDIAIIDKDINLLTGTPTANENCSLNVSASNIKATSIDDSYITSFNIYVNGIKGMEVEFDIDFNSVSNNANMFGIYQDRYLPNYNFSDVQPLGNHKIRYRLKEDGVNIITIAMKTNDEANVTWDFDIKSVKPVRDTPVSIISPNIEIGTPLHIDRHVATLDLACSRDFIVLEKWEEDITERDFIFCYGNVLSKASNSLIPSDKLTSYSNTDKNGYCSFGVWDSDGVDAVGYRWSELTNEEKILLANDSRNNIFLKDDKWYQIRYRVRSMRGVGNRSEFVGVDSRALAYDSTPGRFGKVSKQGDAPTVLGDADFGYDDHKNYNRKSTYPGCYESIENSYGGDSVAMALFSVQRRNRGIYHPIFNPVGTALIYVNGSAKRHYEANGIIKRLRDCFDPELIACVKDQNLDDAVSLSDISNDYKRTGSVDSGVTGFPSKDYREGCYDLVANQDVTDFRMNVNRPAHEDLLEKMFFDITTGNFRGVENSLHIDSLTEGLRIDSVTGNILSLKDIHDRIYNIGAALLYGRGMLYNVTKNRLFHIVSSSLGSSDSFEISVFDVGDIDSNRYTSWNSVDDEVVLISIKEVNYTANGIKRVCEIIGDIHKLPSDIKRYGHDSLFEINSIDIDSAKHNIVDSLVGNRGGGLYTLKRGTCYKNEVYPESNACYSYDASDDSYKEIPRVVDYSALIDNGTAVGHYLTLDKKHLYFNLNGDGSNSNYENKILFIDYNSECQYVKPALNSEVIAMGCYCKILGSSHPDYGCGLVDNLIQRTSTTNSKLLYQIPFRSFSYESERRLASGNGLYPSVPVNDPYSVEPEANLKVFPYLTKKEENQLQLNLVFKELRNSDSDGGFGDDNRFNISSGKDTIFDSNNNSVQFGTYGVGLSYYI